MDSYQPIYDAVRSRISNGDIGRAVSEALLNVNLGHYADMARASIHSAACQHECPSVLFRPRLFLDGNMYCALYGADLRDGVAGFGKTAQEAMSDFDKNWASQNAPEPKS